MQLAIIGLPYCGKTTVFNAVTRGSAQVADYSGVSRPNVGVAKVPDGRLAPLAEIYKPTRTTQAEIEYVDLPAAPDGLGRTKGISGEYLNRLQTADALVVVARAFEDPSVPDGGDGVDPFRDIETMLYELTFADLEILDRRLERIAQNSKGARGGDRDAMVREQESIARLKEGLDAGLPIRKQSLNQEDARRVAEFQFLTAQASYRGGQRRGGPARRVLGDRGAAGGRGRGERSLLDGIARQAGDGTGADGAGG